MAENKQDYEGRIYYKAVSENMTTTDGYEYKLGEVNKVEYDDEIKLCRYGLHLYKSLENLSEGPFYPRVFKAKVVGNDIHEGIDKIASRRVELIEEIEPSEVKDDEWLYQYCEKVEDKEEIWSSITSDRFIYEYCKDIADREEMWKKIQSNQYIYRYCKDVKDREELVKNFSSEYVDRGANGVRRTDYRVSSYPDFEKEKWMYKYCKNIKDRPEVWKRFSDTDWMIKYCQDIQDRKEIWKSIENPESIVLYCKDVEDREEMWRKLLNVEDEMMIRRPDVVWYGEVVKDRPELFLSLSERGKEDYLRMVRDKEVGLIFWDSMVDRLKLFLRGD